MPLNIRVGRFDLPVGMTLIFLVLAIAAIANLLTKEVATITGVAFTAGFFAVFWISEHAHRRRIGHAGRAPRAPRAVQRRRRPSSSAWNACT